MNTDFPLFAHFVRPEPFSVMGSVRVFHHFKLKMPMLGPKTAENRLKMTKNGIFGHFGGEIVQNRRFLDCKRPKKPEYTPKPMNLRHKEHIEHKRGK